MSGESHRSLDRTRSGSKISGMTLRKSLTKVQDGDVWQVYKKGRKLGSGKSGMCYEGIHRVTKQSFAVKVIRVRNLDDNMKARLIDEIEYMTEMDHPNIVKVFESFRSPTKGDFSLVMELLSGGELYEHLLDSEEGRYDEPVAARLFEMMCKAVAYIHSKKICHRDLKLENFVFDETSEEAQIKLIDFGLSRRHGLGIKRMNTAVGTPYYVAPEVIERGQDYDQACDVWSLGVLLFMMLSGRPPFDAETDRGILSAIRKCRYDFSDPIWATIGSSVKDLIQRMLVTNPKKRIKPADILQHPWVQQASSAKFRAPVNAVIAKNLRNFMSVSALKRTTMEMIALSLNPSQIKGLQAEFEKIDTNKDGVLTLEEFHHALQHKMPRAEIENLFSELDGDCSGHIEYSEFVSAAIACTNYLPESQLRLAFNRLDADGSGTVEFEDLKQLFPDNIDEANDMMKELNIKPHQQITYEHFLELMRPRKHGKVDPRQARLQAAINREDEAAYTGSNPSTPVAERDREEAPALPPPAYEGSDSDEAGGGGGGGASKGGKKDKKKKKDKKNKKNKKKDAKDPCTIM